MDRFDPAAAAAVALFGFGRLVQELVAAGVLTVDDAQAVVDGAAQDAGAIMGPPAEAIADQLTASLNLLRGGPGRREPRG